MTLCYFPYDKINQLGFRTYEITYTRMPENIYIQGSI